MASNTGVSYGPGVFTDEEFERAGKEVVEPELDGWEFYVESMNTKIYRKYKEVSLCVVHSSTMVCTVVVTSESFYRL